MKTTSLKLLIGLIVLLFAYPNVFAEAGATQIRNVGVFNAIKLQNSANVYITKGDVQSIKVEADEKIIDKIRTRLLEGKLVIDNENEFSTNKEIKIYITVKELCTVITAGSGNVESKSSFTCKDFSAEVSGSGNIRMMIEAEKTYVTVTGSGDVVLNGKSSTSKVTIAGSGNADLRNLLAADASVQVVGSGNCKINASDNLDSKVTGSGNIYYVKQAAHHTEKIVGSGSVLKL